MEDEGYFVNRADRKNCGASLGISQKLRNSRRVSGGEIGAKGMVAKGENWRSPGTKYKRSKIAFAVTSIMIALSLGSLGPQLLGLASQSLIGSPGTLLPSH